MYPFHTDEGGAHHDPDADVLLYVYVSVCAFLPWLCSLSRYADLARREAADASLRFFVHSGNIPFSWPCLPACRYRNHRYTRSEESGMPAFRQQSDIKNQGGIVYAAYSVD